MKLNVFKAHIRYIPGRMDIPPVKFKKGIQEVPEELVQNMLDANAAEVVQDEKADEKVIEKKEPIAEKPEKIEKPKKTRKLRVSNKK